VGEPHCTTKLENTHVTEFRELLYPWHPWFGLQVGVHEAIEKSDGIVFRCNLSGSKALRWLEIPAWMFDRTACANLRVAADGHPDLAALIALGALLRHVPNRSFASSNTPLSDASKLSREENRGEIHVTADEADTGTPLRAATNRPVRRRNADNVRQHAGLVRTADRDTSIADLPDDTVNPGSYRQEEPDRRDTGGRP